jgi:hypothetical protein
MRLDRTPLVDQTMDPTTQENREYSESISRTSRWPVCDKILPAGSLAHGGCKQMAKLFDAHRAFSLGVISILSSFIFAVWPLSLQCRRRRRRHRRQIAPYSASLSSGRNSHSHASLSDAPSNASGNYHLEAPVNERTPLVMAGQEEHGTSNTPDALDQQVVSSTPSTENSRGCEGGLHPVISRSYVVKSIKL